MAAGGQGCPRVGAGEARRLRFGPVYYHSSSTRLDAAPPKVWDFLGKGNAKIGSTETEGKSCLMQEGLQVKSQGH